MNLWQILVLGVVRLGLDADWDRLEHIANDDMLVRQILGVPATPWGEDAKGFARQTLRDNVALLDDELLRDINARIAAAGREVFAKKGGAPVAALEIKVDTCVLEADVHFPTDLNLLWDAGRKCVDLVVKYRDQLGCALPGWRKVKAWRRQLKTCERLTSQIVYRGGRNKEARVKRAVREYLTVGRALSAKVQASLLGLCDQPVDAAGWEALAYFHTMLAKHLDLVERRLLNEETIPPHKKVFSLVEPHTEWIQKGKQRPNVELGHRLLIATDQHQLIQDYAVPVAEGDVDQSVPVADRLLGRYGPGSLASLSFDKGFTPTEDRELLRLYVPLVVMPRRGRKNARTTFLSRMAEATSPAIGTRILLGWRRCGCWRGLRRCNWSRTTSSRQSGRRFSSQGGSGTTSPDGTMRAGRPGGCFADSSRFCPRMNDLAPRGARPKASNAWRGDHPPNTTTIASLSFRGLPV